MSEKITWTHVDRYVRDAHDKRGMLPMGPTDADCALAYIKWLERTLVQKEQTVAVRTELLETTRRQLAEAKARPVKKSKQRIADLEENVEIISRHLGLEL